MRAQLDALERSYEEEGGRMMDERGGVLPDEYRIMFEKYTNLRSKLQMFKLAERDSEFGRKTRGWLWILVGPVLASAVILTLMLFIDVAVLQRLAGGEPFRHLSALMMLAMAIGTSLNGLLTIRGVVLQVKWFSLYSESQFSFRITDQLLQVWTVTLLLVGIGMMLHLDGNATFAGGCLVALALPSVWWITIGLIRKLSVHGAVGRVFGCASLSFFVYQQLYMALVCGSLSALFRDWDALGNSIRCVSANSCPFVKCTANGLDRFSVCVIDMS